MAREDIFFITIGILFIINILIILVFSSINLLTILCNWRTHCRSVVNLLTVNSCIAFLLYTVIASLEVPLLFQVNEEENENRFSPFCRLRGFLFLMSCAVKSISYLMQAISRFFTTVLYKYQILLSYRVHGMMIGLTWMVSITLASSIFISPTAYRYEPESRLCILSSKVFETSFTAMSVAFIAPVVIIIILYCIIIYKTARSNQISSHIITNGNQKRNVKVFQNILRLWAVVLMGGTPYVICILINKVSHTPWPLYSIAILFITISSATESFIVFFTNKEVKRLFCMKIGIRRAQEMQGFAKVAKIRKLPNRTRMGTDQVIPIIA